jgi:mono/diheme cytochrome c family protein
MIGAMRTLVRVVVVIVLIAAVAGAAGWWYVSGRGFSAREQPTWIEAAVARRLRHLALPRGARDRRSPIAASPEVIEEGLAHFADHCATCHANDGSGQTDIGRNLYPKPPDMRAPTTQSLSDGELFYIIEHGVRLTGMPAWGTGTPESERASWHLVHFIRHLPKLTPSELERMAQLNPKSADEWRKEAQDGRDGKPASRKPTHEHHH